MPHSAKQGKAYFSQAGGWSADYPHRAGFGKVLSLFASGQWLVAVSIFSAEPRRF